MPDHEALQNQNIFALIQLYQISREFSETLDHIPPLFKSFFPQGVIAEQSKDDLQEWVIFFLFWSVVDI